MNYLLRGSSALSELRRKRRGLGGHGRFTQKMTSSGMEERRNARTHTTNSEIDAYPHATSDAP